MEGQNEFYKSLDKLNELLLLKDTQLLNSTIQVVLDERSKYTQMLLQKKMNNDKTTGWLENKIADINWILQQKLKRVPEDVSFAIRIRYMI